jgi:epoxide hydrolase-like predicted phosphatase
MAGIEAVISDFGGVLTSPLIASFAAFQESSGISPQDLGQAIAEAGARLGANPLFELETGQLTEREFLGSIAERLTEQLGRPVDLSGFGERYFSRLEPNEPLIAYMRRLRERGYKLAICTNNVREWESRWRAMLPVDEIFDVVVDSAFVGTRKPERRIYELTLERLGVDARSAIFVDDLQANCDGARAIGIEAVWFRCTEQAIADMEAILGTTPASDGET